MRELPFIKRSKMDLGFTRGDVDDGVVQRDEKELPGVAAKYSKGWCNLDWK
jgi:hypothetical protein